MATQHEDLASHDNRTKGSLACGTHPEPQVPREAASVAAHYNAIGDRHRTLVTGSNILQTRNLNNWIKSVLIGKYMSPKHSVLDLACGKGGDLLKFKAGKCGSYVGIDIAVQSVRDAVSRYNGSNGRAPMPFPALFGAGDFAATCIDQALPQDIRFNLVSCQASCALVRNA